MFCLTYQERKVLLGIGIVILAGSFLRSHINSSRDVNIIKPLIDFGSTHQNEVNINTATQSELETLTGIGPKIAARILEYRSQNGLFDNSESLKKVKGIGDKKIQVLEHCITF